MSDYCTFIEIEEGCLTMTIAEQHRSGFELIIQMPTNLPSLGRSDVLDALKRILGSLPGRVESAHVALGERRSLHFLPKVPMLAPHEMNAFVDREAHRLGSLAPDVKVLSSSRYIQSLKGNTHLFGAVALPAHVWEPIGEAFAELGIEVLSLCTVEDAIADVLPEQFPSPAAALEVSAGRVRFIYIEQGAVSHVRRFLLPGGDDALQDPTMVATQLAMEVPRTMDYLSDLNCEPVESLLISHKLGLDTNLASMVSGDVERFEVFDTAIKVDASQQPGLATYGMMQRVLAGKVPSLLHEEMAVVPVGMRAKMFAAAGLMLGVGAAVGGVYLLDQKQGHERTLADAQRRLESVEAEHRAWREEEDARALAESALDPAEKQLAQVLQERRPSSVMLASVANAAPENVFIERVTFAQGYTIVVTGRVEGASRLESLDGISAFSNSLGRVSCVRRVDETVVGGTVPGHMSFTFHLDWRSS